MAKSLFELRTSNSKLLLAGLQDRLRQQARPVPKLLQRRVAEGEADVLLAAAVRHEVRPDVVDDVVWRREFGQLRLAGAAWQLHPDKEAAFRPTPGSIGVAKNLVKGGEHRVALVV